ncbi:uncharacterized protein VP01_85g6 [Puccinia sorghi]|uniref:Homeobox domain-containing protein n=1 Tax=Puccinia sorghi TaxID=27349 RepID=A0A0L6U910_9BASI|nr:uncharacterized protein VP01_85g6 [Puccinia sorghi]
MLFQVCAHNLKPAECISSTSLSSGSTSSATSSVEQQQQLLTHQLISHPLKTSSSHHSTTSLLLPDYLNSPPSPIHPHLTLNTNNKNTDDDDDSKDDNTVSDSQLGNHHNNITTIHLKKISNNNNQPLLISTLNLLPIGSASTSSSSSSSAIDHPQAELTLNSKPITISPASIWPSSSTSSLDPFHPQQFHHQQQPPSSSSSSSPDSHPHHQITPLLQPQPRSQTAHMLTDPSSELILAHTNDLLSSPTSPTALISHQSFNQNHNQNQNHNHNHNQNHNQNHNHNHNHHHHHRNHHHYPLYQHSFTRHNSIESSIDHPSFTPSHPYPLPHQHHPHNLWNGSAVDLGPPTTFYDPFQSVPHISSPFSFSLSLSLSPLIIHVVNINILRVYCRSKKKNIRRMIKHRRRTTPAQLNILEAQFQLNCKPDVALRKQLADRLDMTPREVQVWVSIFFQNRRAKTKKLEKRAEQESGKGTDSEVNGNSTRPAASPPASVYLSPPSLQAVALPVSMNETSDQQLRIGVSPPSLTTGSSTVALAIGESEEGEEGEGGGVHFRFNTNPDRRYRSYSLHHHPYYLPPSNILTGQANNACITTPTPMTIGNGSLSQHQPQRFSDPSGADDLSLIGRRSSNTSIASSTVTATDSNLIQTPTHTEFHIDDGKELPNGFDPRRRSSCPAEFIQSFGHFGLANGQLTDVTNAQMGLYSFMPTNQSDTAPKLSLDPNACAPFTILEDQVGGWDSQVEGWKTDVSREGIQRRHSLATMDSPLEMHEFQSNGVMLSNEPGLNVTPNGLLSWGATGYPTPKLLSSFESHNPPTAPMVTASNGSNGGSRLGGYGRRASTSVLKSIEEHPGNVWN